MNDTLVRLVRKLLEPIQRRVRLMVARAVVNLIDDSARVQVLQLAVRADELRDDAERFQEYGLTSVPLSGAEAIVLFVGGDTSHPVVVAVDDRRYRPKPLEPGEVALYTQQNGKRVYLTAAGLVLLGTDPTDFVALATNTDARLAALEAHALAHSHGGVLAGPSATSTPVPPFSAGVGGASVAATEVKGK